MKNKGSMSASVASSAFTVPRTFDEEEYERKIERLLLEQYRLKQKIAWYQMKVGEMEKKLEEGKQLAEKGKRLVEQLVHYSRLLPASCTVGFIDFKMYLGDWQAWLLERIEW